MFVLLWSLVINVISYVRRRRLRSQTEMQMARGYGVVLRLIRGDLESNGRRTIIGSPLYRTESVELVSSDIKVRNRTIKCKGTLRFS